VTPWPPGSVPPGPPQGRFECSRCGVVLWNDCVPLGHGFWLCVECAGCCRCGALVVETFRVGPKPGDRACRGCLTVEEQAARGLESTLPDAG
jgi:hypothetical protein